jgi:hypothetical protein
VRFLALKRGTIDAVRRIFGSSTNKTSDPSHVNSFVTSVQLSILVLMQPLHHT